MRANFYILAIALFSLFVTGCAKDEDQFQINSTMEYSMELIGDPAIFEMAGPRISQEVSHLFENTSISLSTNFTVTINPNIGFPLPADGITQRIAFVGDFNHTMEIRVLDMWNHDVLCEIPEVRANTEYIIEIPPFYSDTESYRVLLYEYYDPFINYYSEFAVFLQYAHTKSDFNITSNITEDIPASGGQYIVSISGSYPSTPTDQVQIMAHYWNGHMWRILDYVTIKGQYQKSAYLNIPALEEGEEEREVVLIFDLGDEKNIDAWTVFEVHKQKYKELVLSNGSIVAEEDLPTTMNWATAMGINTSYNYNVFNSSGIYVPSNLWGCGAYYEGSEDAIGTGQFYWRLPTSIEMGEIIIRRAELKNDLKSGINTYYWSSTQSNGSIAAAWPAWTMGNTPYSLEKTETRYVRCVRTIY